jgi:hypothetical protein
VAAAAIETSELVDALLKLFSFRSVQPGLWIDWDSVLQMCRCPRFPLAAAIALLALPAASHAAHAQAPPVRDCGNYGFLPGGSRPVFTQREIEGAGTYDITARVSTCRTARRVVRIAHRARNNPCTRYDENGLPVAERNPCRVIGFTCRSRRLGIELSSVPCSAPGDG